MEEIYMPIPDAPNYGINDSREVINFKTGRALKIYKNKARIRKNGRQYWSLVENLYQQALDAYTGAAAFWKAVPSLDFKYEITFDGGLRKSSTKRRLKTYKVGSSLYVDVYLRGKKVRRLVRELVAEIYPAKAFRRKHRKIAVQISKGHERYHFNSCRACAIFLSKKVYYSDGTVAKKLQARSGDVYGWAAKYF